VSIPLTDMGALSSYAALDALRVKQAAVEGKGPKYYLDDIQFEETGAPVEFFIRPEKGTWLWIESIKMTMADAHTGITTVAGATETATLPNLPYNKFLSLAQLDTGMVFNVVNDGVSTFGGTAKNLFDLMQFPGASLSGYGGDGTNAWLTITLNVTVPFVLKSEDNDYMKMVISDDLSGLLSLRWTAGCREEARG